MIKGVIFDMDGLIVDSEIVAEKAWKIVLNELNIDTGRLEDAEFIGLGQKTIIKILEQKYNDLETTMDWVEVMGKVKDTTRKLYKTDGLNAKPGLYELLDYLEANNIAKAVASSSFKADVDQRLKMVGVENRFSVRVCGDEVKKGKPNPEIFQTACKRLGLEPEDVFVLEDSIPGVSAGKAADMKVIIIPDLVEHPIISVEKAYEVCKSLFDVIDEIEKYNN